MQPATVLMHLIRSYMFQSAVRAFVIDTLKRKKSANHTVWQNNTILIHTTYRIDTCMYYCNLHRRILCFTRFLYKHMALVNQLYSLHLSMLPDTLLMHLIRVIQVPISCKSFRHRYAKRERRMQITPFCRTTQS